MIMDLLSDLLDPFGRSGSRKTKRSKKPRNQTPQGTHTLTVQKPYCTPAKSIILAALKPYGVRVHGIHEYVIGWSPSGYSSVDLTSTEALSVAPVAQEAKITINKSQAGWAEYLLWRTGKLSVVKGSIDDRNREWAAKYGGKMPTPWSAKHNPDAQIEPGCARGHKLWRAVQKKGGKRWAE